MYCIELVLAGKVETLGWWPDAPGARAIAGHYRRACQGDPGYICVRVRRYRRLS